jgi:hypothetical protein
MALDNLGEEQKSFLSSQGLADVTAAPPPQFLRRIFQAYEGPSEASHGGGLGGWPPRKEDHQGSEGRDKYGKRAHSRRMWAIVKASPQSQRAHNAENGKKSRYENKWVWALISGLI